MTTEIANLNIDKIRPNITKIPATNLTEVEILERPFTEDEQSTTDVALVKDIVLEEEDNFTPDDIEEEEYTEEEISQYDELVEYIKKLKLMIIQLDNLAAAEATKNGKNWSDLKRNERMIFRKILLKNNVPLVKSIKLLADKAKTVNLADVFGDVGYARFIDPATPIAVKYIYIKDAVIE